MANIEKLKQEKRDLEREALHQKSELDKAQNELNAFKREHDRHHAEFERFKADLAAAERSQASTKNRKIA